MSEQRIAVVDEPGKKCLEIPPDIEVRVLAQNQAGALVWCKKNVHRPVVAPDRLTPPRTRAVMSEKPRPAV